MLKKIKINDIRCGTVNNTFENNVESIKFENIKLEEMNEIFKDSLEILEEGETSNIFSNEVEFVRLKLCKKEMDDNNILSKTDIEKQIYSQKFNQMANTLISNLRKNTNIKFFNK